MQRAINHFGAHIRWMAYCSLMFPRLWWEANCQRRCAMRAITNGLSVYFSDLSHSLLQKVQKRLAKRRRFSTFEWRLNAVITQYLIGSGETFLSMKFRLAALKTYF